MDRLEEIKIAHGDCNTHIETAVCWLILEVEDLRAELAGYQQAKKDWLEAFASEDSVRNIHRLAAETVGLRQQLAVAQKEIDASDVVCDDLSDDTERMMAEIDRLKRELAAKGKS